MQLSDREIQNTIDLLKQKKLMKEEEIRALSQEEIEGIHRLVKKMGPVPEVRMDKVEKVRKALESSTYDVSDDDIAKKLIGRIFSDKLR